ncbi:MAG: 50S ribosomal protein L11 methyltransferase, partial [Bacteroidetes bacterium]|nr:50S ribosomal protein L11 methyltransferase [Bacteroidota bacterium]
ESQMDYIEITFSCLPEQSDILVALLSENDFEMFEETDGGLKGFIQQDLFSEKNLEHILSSISDSGNISFTTTLIKDQNWNALWESNFEPVIIGNEVYVRAPFHPEVPSIKHEIIIEPKMSFGTGHHATTSLMMEEMLRMNFQDEVVLDMGSGSGILAILAAKLGAKNILAIDTDEWAFKNAFENCRRNQSQHIIVQKGDVRLIHGRAFDVILANINRNVLLSDLGLYVAALRSEGHLLVSGFIAEDADIILAEGEKNNLAVRNRDSQSNWMMIHFQKAT